jgi:hypothetical protein
MGLKYLAGERHHDGKMSFDIQVAVNSWQTVNGGEVEESVYGGGAASLSPLAGPGKVSVVWDTTKVVMALGCFGNWPLTMRASRPSRNTSCDRASCMQPVSACE